MVKAESPRSTSTTNDSDVANNHTPNGTSRKRKGLDEEGTRKKKRKSKTPRENGTSHKRRHSVSKPARDPRDEAPPLRSSMKGLTGSRSSTPVIDFDGLSKPSMLFLPSITLYYLDFSLKV